MRISDWSSDVCSSDLYGVPPFMIGHNEKTTSWGSGVAEMGTGFVRYVLRPHLNAFQNEINRKFFRTAGRLAEFDPFELERADLKTLFATFRMALGRAVEPGGRKRLVRGQSGAVHCGLGGRCII